MASGGAKLLHEILRISTDHLSVVPVFTGTKRRERVAEAHPPPEELARQGADETGAVVTVAEYKAVFHPAILLNEVKGTEQSEGNRVCILSNGQVGVL